MNAVRYMLVLSVLLGSSVVSAQSSNLVQSDRATAGGVPAEVLVVLAKEEAGSIDPELKKLTALRRPPFNSFRSMQILSKD